MFSECLTKVDRRSSRGKSFQLYWRHQWPILDWLILPRYNDTSAYIRANKNTERWTCGTKINNPRSTITRPSETIQLFSHQVNNSNVETLKDANFGSKNNEKSKMDFTMSMKLSYHFWNEKNVSKVCSSFELSAYCLYLFCFARKCCHRIPINVRTWRRSQSITMCIQHSTTIMNRISVYSHIPEIIGVS